MTQKYAGLLSLEGPLREWWMMVGRSKSTEPAQMELAMQIRCSIQQLAELLGHWAIKSSLLTPSQKSEGQALGALASELSAKLEEGRGAEKADRELTRTPSKRKSSGRR